MNSYSLYIYCIVKSELTKKVLEKENSDTCVITNAKWNVYLKWHILCSNMLTGRHF
jgi:hypothetical protein